MTYDEIKKWLEDNNYQNSGLRTDRNHRVDLYLSDVICDFAQQQVENLSIHDVGKQRELLFAFITWYADKFEMKFTDEYKTKLVDEFKSKL